MLAVTVAIGCATVGLWALAVRPVLDMARHRAGYVTRYVWHKPYRCWDAQAAYRRRNVAGWKLLVLMIALLVIIITS